MMCAFDSIYHIIGFAMNKNATYKKYLISLKNNILDFFISIINKKEISIETDVLKKRTQLFIQEKFVDETSLRPCTRTQAQSQDETRQFKSTDRLNAENSIMPILLQAFANAPSVQRIQSCYNGKQDEIRISPFVIYPLDCSKLSKKGYSHLLEIINLDLDVELNCGECEVNKKVQLKVPSKFIFFEHTFY